MSKEPGAVHVWLFYMQQQFDDAYWERDDSWSYEEATLNGSSFYNLPIRLAQLVTGPGTPVS